MKEYGGLLHVFQLIRNLVLQKFDSEKEERKWPQDFEIPEETKRKFREGTYRQLQIEFLDILDLAKRQEKERRTRARRNDEEKALKLHRKGLEIIARDLELLKGSMAEVTDDVTRKRESVRVADEIYRLLKRVATTVMRKVFCYRRILVLSV